MAQLRGAATASVVMALLGVRPPRPPCWCCCGCCRRLCHRGPAGGCCHCLCLGVRPSPPSPSLLWLLFLLLSCSFRFVRSPVPGPVCFQLWVCCFVARKVMNFF